MLVYFLGGFVVFGRVGIDRVVRFREFGGIGIGYLGVGRGKWYGKRVGYVGVVILIVCKLGGREKYIERWFVYIGIEFRVL